MRADHIVPYLFSRPFFVLLSGARRFILALFLAAHALIPGDDCASAAAGEMTMPPRVVEGRQKFDRRVVVVGMGERFSAEAWPEAEQRAIAELRALGFGVVHVQARAEGLESRMAELGTRAGAERAMGAVRIVRQGEQQLAKIWLHDSLTGKMLLRTIKIGTAGSADAGMRVVELIYASLLETELRDEGATPPAIHKLVRDRLAQVRGVPKKKPQPPRQWSLTLAPALEIGPGGGGVAVAITIGLERMITPRFSIGAAILAPIGALGVEGEAGEADLQLTLTRVEAAYLFPLKRWLTPSLFLGSGLLVLRSNGRALPPALSDVDWAFAFAATAGARLAIALAPDLSLRLGAGLSLSLPGLGVRVADERVATVGRPLVETSMGIAWRWR